MNRYPAFFEKTFLSEGYFQDMPEDRGNWYQGKLYGTICGITARDHFTEFNLAIELYKGKKFELLKDFCMRFYQKKGYWNELYNDVYDSSLAFKIWDFGVNAGPYRAVKLVQKVIVKYWGITIAVDGQFGSFTLLAVNKGHYLGPEKVNGSVQRVEGESILYAYYIWRLEKYYRSLDGFWKFGRNWLRRLKEVFNKVPDKIKGIFIKSKGLDLG